MKIDLKTTIFLSSLLALVLNLIHFAPEASAKVASVSSVTTTASATPISGPFKLSDLPPSGTTTATLASVSTTTASSTVSAVAARLSSDGLNPSYASLYVAAQNATGTPWQLLAAVHHVESGQSGNTTRTSSAGATGPMQFIPATFNHYAMDGNGDGVKDVDNVSDAVFTAGRYLAANGASHGAYGSALYAYNHSWGYVSVVTGVYSQLGL